MRFTIERTVHIRRSPAEIYAFLAKVENHPRFVESVVSMRALTPGPLQVGTPLEVVRALPGIHEPDGGTGARVTILVGATTSACFRDHRAPHPKGPRA